MEFRQLYSFSMVVQLGNLSLAAEKLGYSQSAVTIQIKKLEEELVVHLFDRIGHRMVLTNDGSLFLPYVNRILGELNMAKLAMEPSSELTGTLRIGAVESQMMFYVDRIIRVMHKLHPKVTFRIATGTPEELCGMLDSNQVDIICILEKKVNEEKWIRLLEKKEEIVFVSSPSRKICEKEEISVKDLLNEPMILTENNANYRKAFDQYLIINGLNFRPFMEVSSTQYILQSVTDMNCVSFLPLYVVDDYIKKGHLIRLNVPELNPEMYSQFFYHRDKWKTREMEEFSFIAQEVTGVGTFS